MTNIRAIRNRNARKLDSSAKHGSHVNCVHINPANSIEHEVKKLEVCYMLRKNGIDFYTETKFNNGARADIYSLDDDCAREIVCSETEASIVRKRNTYPCDVIVVFA